MAEIEGGFSILKLNLETDNGPRSENFVARRLIIAGWTGRDREAMEKHIAELEELGVTPPKSTPVFYRLSPRRLTTAASIQVVGDDSSGEVEFVLVNIDGVLWVGVGSDHTDRKVETYGITVSKQMCDKLIAETLWPYDRVKDGWDSLVLRSYVEGNGARRVYQEGTASEMLAVSDLLRSYQEAGNSFEPGDVMFGGTLPVIGGVTPSEWFEFELVDESRAKAVRHAYSVVRLPVAG